MRKLLYVVFALAAAAPAAIGQALPELGDAASLALPPQIERRIGEEAYREIRAKDPKFMDDPEIEQYVSDLGQRLVAVSGEARQPFEFFVIHDPSINAFAMPGGFVGVHTGLLLVAQSESELASVLAHEVSHITQHHIARMASQQSQLSAAGLAAFVLAMLSARSNPDMAQAAIASATAGSLQLQLNYSRDFEREADRIGFQLLHDAGFDVHAMPVFFERLHKSVRLHETGAPAYLRTHPVSLERMADMQNRALSVPYRQAADSLFFHLVRAKLRAGQGTASEAVSRAQDQLREKRYGSEIGARYSLVTALLRARQLARAEREMAALRRMNTVHPMIDLLEARLKNAAGNVRTARDILRAASARDALYRPVSYAYVDALQGLGDHKAALDVLQQSLRIYPRDPRFYGLQAKSFSASGQTLLQHKALAEQYYLMGALPAAIEQLQLAQRSLGGDFYQLSAVEARLRQLRLEQAARAKQEGRRGKAGDGG